MRLLALFNFEKKSRGKRFDSINKIQIATQTFANSIKKEEFEKTILVKWEERLKLLVKNGGRYLKQERIVDSYDEENLLAYAILVEILFLIKHLSLT